MKPGSLNTVLPAPERAATIPTDAQWLSGEGGGSWFFIEEKGSLYTITRFSPGGKIECKGDFFIDSGYTFDVRRDFEFVYMSHCSEVTIVQETVRHTFRLRARTTE